MYAARKRLRSVTDSVSDTNYIMNNAPLNKEDAKNMPSNKTKAPDLTTTERIPIASIPPELSQWNLTEREIKLRRVRLQLQTLLNSTRTVADYIADSDRDTLTRKFDELVEKNQIKIPTKTRREYYYSSDTKAQKLTKRENKRRLRELMSHFIYITRYKLAFAQVLRQKYYDNTVYKIGFLYGLLRHLKNMQKWVYWALDTNGHTGNSVVGTVQYGLKMVEKLQRLDVDIKDVILLIKKWEFRTNIAINPNYYDYSMENYNSSLHE